MTRAFWIIFAGLLLVVGLAVACGEEPKEDIPETSDYTECTESPQNNPVTICDSMKRAVEALCGFSLTVDHCACYDEVAPCAVSSEGISEVVMAFLEGVLACEDSVADCTEYMVCLEILGEVDNCSNPTEWNCITTTEAQGQTEE